MRPFKADGIFSRLSNLVIVLIKQRAEKRADIKLVGLHDFLVFHKSSNMVTLVLQKQMR